VERLGLREGLGAHASLAAVQPDLLVDRERGDQTRAALRHARRERLVELRAVLPSSTTAGRVLHLAGYGARASSPLRVAVIAMSTGEPSTEPESLSKWTQTS